MTSVAAGDTEGTVSTALNLGGDVALLDLLDGKVGRGDGEGGGDVGGAVDLGDVGLGVTLLGGVGLAGEQDQALLVGLEAGDVDGQGLLREVLAAGVDGDTDGGSLEAGDTSFLQRLLIFKNFLQSAVILLLRRTTAFRRFAIRTLSSASVKPRPARTLRLYLRVGHRTIGRNLSTGRGATAAALV